jgi:dihydrofolate synthase / folylpolyglutamate synthase
MSNQLLDKLYQNNPHAIKMGLDNVLKLDEYLNFPSKQFKSIHIAGTNGKGSVSTKIAQTLYLSGYKIGLFTSPHISSFNERIQINGEAVSKKILLSSLKKVFDLTEKYKMSPTFFEINTLVVFDIFADQKVDFGVIEVGLGGRLDSTNIITPLLSIITSISFDHTHILGDTLEKIAFEKAGIIKEGVPVIVGPKADFQVIKEKAFSLTSPLIKVKEVDGWYDSENSEIAKTALNYLKNKWHLSSSAIEQGVQKRPSCRLEIYSEESNKISKEFEKIPKAIIFDVAHNPNGFENLFKALKLHFEGLPIRIILGMSKDKDIATCSKLINSNVSAIHVISPSHERLIAKEELALFFPKNKVEYEDDLKKTIKAAVSKAASNGEILVICGSFFIMKDIRKILLQNHFNHIGCN